MDDKRVRIADSTGVKMIKDISRYSWQK